MDRRSAAYHLAPAKPSSDTRRRSKEFDTQYEMYCSLRKKLCQQYGSHSWCVICCEELVGVFDTVKTAEDAGQKAATKHNTDVFLVGPLQNS